MKNIQWNECQKVFYSSLCSLEIKILNPIDIYKYDTTLGVFHTSPCKCLISSSTTRVCLATVEVTQRIGNVNIAPVSSGLTSG